MALVQQACKMACLVEGCRSAWEAEAYTEELAWAVAHMLALALVCTLALELLLACMQAWWVGVACKLGEAGEAHTPVPAQEAAGRCGWEDGQHR